MANCKDIKDIEDQCILVHNIEKLSKSSGHLKLLNINSDIMTFMNGSAADFMSTLRKGINKQISPLLGITPAELSLLVPMIKLYRVAYTNTNPRKFAKQWPIKFRDHNDQSAVDSVLRTGRGRLGNVGIESVSIQQAGQTAAGTGYYMVNLKLFAESIDAFFNEQEDENYLDLISYRPKKRRDDPDANTKVKDPFTKEEFPKEQIWDPLNYELKAIFGWSVPKDKTKMIRKEIVNALKNCQMLFRLGLNSHSIDFNQNGTVSISIQYHAGLENLLSSFRADLFHDPALVTERASSFTSPDDLPGLKEAQDELRERAQAEGVQDFDPETATAELKDQLARSRAKREITGEQISKIYNILEEKNAFRYMTPRSIDAFITTICDPAELALLGIEGARSLLEDETIARQSTDGTNYTKASTYLSKLNLEKEKSKIKAQSAAPPSTDDISTEDAPRAITRTIPYVYLANIIDVLNELIQDKNKLPANVFNYRVLLGPLEYVDRVTRERRTINLGQIPVSTHDLNRFINNNIIKNGVTSMSYMVFLKKIIKELAVDSLGKKCLMPGANLLKQSYFKSSVEATMITTTPKGGKDPFSSIEDNVIDIAQLGETFGTNPGLFSKKESIGLSRKTKTFDYLIIHASYLPIPYRDGNKVLDEADGIYHLFLGKDRGMVNQINFSKMNMPSRRLYLMRNEVSQIDQLIERYNAQVELFGMPTLIPGQLVHINPAIAALGNSKNPDSYGSRLGLTGYYYITRITHDMQGNKSFKTKLECSGMGPVLGTSKPITKITADSASSSQSKSPDDSSKKPKDGQNETAPQELSQDTRIQLANTAFSMMHGTAAFSGQPGDREAVVANTFGVGAPDVESLASVPSSFLDQFGRDSLDRQIYPPQYPEHCANHLNGAPIAKAVIMYLNSLYPPTMPEYPYSQPPDDYNFYDIVMELDGMVFESNFENEIVNPGADSYNRIQAFKDEYDLPYTVTNTETGKKYKIVTEEDHEAFINDETAPASSFQMFLQAVIPANKDPLRVSYFNNRQQAFVQFKFIVPRTPEELSAIQEIKRRGGNLPPDINVVEKTYLFSCHRDVALGWFIYDFKEKAPRQIKLPPESLAFVVLGSVVGLAAVTADVMISGGVGTAVALGSAGAGAGSLAIQENIEDGY